MAARKPSGVAADYAFQVATYSLLMDGRASGEVRLDTLVATKVPQLVTLEYRVLDDDRRLCETLYPRVQSAMRAGYVVPNRGSNLCSAKQFLRCVRGGVRGAGEGRQGGLRSN